MSEQATPPEQPTAQQMAAAGEVSEAVAQAAADAPNAAQARQDAAAAARQAADRVNLEINDEQIKAISNGVVNAMEARGAFEPPPEQVAPPAPSAPAPAEPGTPPAAPPAPDVGPRKRSFAQRFLGE